jgi:hypothetical protein
MERDKSHEEQIERWAKFVRENPDKWKKEHTKFINSVILKARAFYSRLYETEEGRKILLRLRENKLSLNR